MTDLIFHFQSFFSKLIITLHFLNHCVNLYCLPLIHLLQFSCLILTVILFYIQFIFTIGNICNWKSTEDSFIYPPFVTILPFSSSVVWTRGLWQLAFSKDDLCADNNIQAFYIFNITMYLRNRCGIWDTMLPMVVNTLKF